MRAAAFVICIAAFVGISAAKEPEKYAVWGTAGVVYGKNELMEHGVWVTGDVIHDKNEGLMFRADKAVQGNATGNLVYLAIPEDLAKSFGPMCYRAAVLPTGTLNYGYAEHFCRIPVQRIRISRA
jgi:hypothetical protein